MIACFIDSGLEHCNFWNTDISQGSIVTQLKCGGIINDNFCYKFTNESVSEGILKISQHLAKLWAIL